MSQENVELVRHFYEALNLGDWDAAFRDAHPDVALTIPRGPHDGTHRRREAVQKFLEDFTEAFEEYKVEPERFLEMGDQIVVVVVSQHGRPRGGSVDIVTRNGHLWTVRDGSIVSMELFPDPDDALKAAGLAQ